MDDEVYLSNSFFASASTTVKKTREPTPLADSLGGGTSGNNVDAKPLNSWTSGNNVDAKPLNEALKARRKTIKLRIADD